MPDLPLVSVIMATYQMARFLPEAIASILAQDYAGPLELIVIDDGSTDDTPQVLDGYRNDPRVRIITQENAGQTVAKNRGLAAARGELIGFCDADDAWLPDKLSRQVPCFQNRPDLGVVYGDVQFIDDRGEALPTPSKRRPSGWITGPLLADNFVPFNTTLVPRRILEEMGGFDESLSMAIDYDLWLRISVSYEFLHLNRVLALYRIWGGQMSHRTGERLDNAFRMMETFLARFPEAVSAADVRRAWAHTFTTRGLWHAREGRWRAALTDYGRALARVPWDNRTWRSLARLARGRR